MESIIKKFSKKDPVIDNKNEAPNEAPENISVDEMAGNLDQEKAELNAQLATLEQEKAIMIEERTKKTENNVAEQEKLRQLEMQKMEIDELRRKVAALQHEKEEAQKVYIGGTATTNRTIPVPKFEDALDVLNYHFSNSPPRRP